MNKQERPAVADKHARRNIPYLTDLWKVLCTADCFWSYLAPFLRYGELLAENCEFFLPHSDLARSFGVTPCEFFDNSYESYLARN